MTRRRTVLGLLGSALGAGTAGCLGRAQEAIGSESPNQDSEHTTAGHDDEAAAAAQSTDDEDLAEATDRIMDELAWFANDYPVALREYRAAGEDLLDTVREVGESVPLTRGDVDRLDGRVDRPRIDQGWPYDVWWDDDERLWRYVPIEWDDPDPDADREPPIDVSALDRLRDATDAFADTIETEFEPHFLGAKKERRFGHETIDEMERFADRDDAAMVIAGLVRLYRHYETVIGRRYINEHLSNDPIENRLTEFLEAPDHDVGTPPLFEVDYRGQNGLVAFAHPSTVGTARRNELYRADPVQTIDGSTWRADEIALQDAVDGLSVGDGRVDSCYLVVNRWDRVDTAGYYSERLPSGTIFVQRYGDATASEAATESLLGRDGVAVVDPETGVGEWNGWTPIRFRFESEPWYGLLRVAGRHVLAAGIARRPFEHRTQEIIGEDWEIPLELAWIRGY